MTDHEKGMLKYCNYLGNLHHKSQTYCVGLFTQHHTVVSGAGRGGRCEHRHPLREGYQRRNPRPWPPQSVSYCSLLKRGVGGGAVQKGLFKCYILKMLFSKEFSNCNKVSTGSVIDHCTCKNQILPQKNQPRSVSLLVPKSLGSL